MEDCGKLLLTNASAAGGRVFVHMLAPGFPATCLVDQHRRHGLAGLGSMLSSSPHPESQNCTRKMLRRCSFA